MSIKLAALSFIRRSPAEVSVLRELIALRQSGRTDPTEGYLALRCQMTEAQLRKVLGRLAKSCLISYQGRERDTRGYKETYYDYALHYGHIRRLIDEGERFVHRTLQERYANSQRSRNIALQGESMTATEGEAKGAIAQVPEASAANQKTEDATAVEGVADKT